jgi:DNA topoisomerase IA
MSPDETMRHAQKLYEAGYITYMRTDSPAVSPEGQQMAQDIIRKAYGEQYLGKTQYKAKDNAQEAHECIRPTDTNNRPEGVRLALGAKAGRAADVYDLIYRRFLASQMANAIYNEVHVSVIGGDSVFSAKGSRLAFDGFLRVYTFDEEKERQTDEDEALNKQLPALTQDGTTAAFHQAANTVFRSLTGQSTGERWCGPSVNLCPNTCHLEETRLCQHSEAPSHTDRIR